MLKLADVNFMFHHNFDIWTEPKWLEDNGSAEIMVKNATILLNLLPSNANGVLNIDFSETKIDIEDYRVNLFGVSDLSKAAQIMMNSFKEFFKKDLANMLAWRLAKSV